MIADSDTLPIGLYAPGDELLPQAGTADADATNVGRPAGAEAADDGFAVSRARFEEVAAWLGDDDAAGLEHAQLEARLQEDGRDLLRALLQDRLDLDGRRERRVACVSDADGVARRAVERDHRRPLGSVFGQVTVTRLAYRARGAENLHVADGVLNLPFEHASHGVRRLAAVESARGSFDEALAAVRERTGLHIGKRQVEQLAARAAVDFDGFYAQRARSPDGDGDGDGDVIVLSADGKGIVMRPDALRPQTAKAAQRASPKLRPACPRARSETASGSRRSAPSMRSRPRSAPPPTCSPAARRPRPPRPRPRASG